MKPLVCEMCGSSDLVKHNGVFECQHCGTKYSLEEAKRMMFSDAEDSPVTTVKIDNTDKLQKLYQIARRSKADNNTASAARYYDMILQEDPMSWEASFYTTYYACLQTNIAGIQSAANTISNSLHSVLTLIDASSMDPADKKKAIHEINGKLKSIAAVFYRGSIKHYVEISDRIRSQYTAETFGRAYSAVEMLFHLGDQIDNVFSNQKKLCNEAIVAWQAGLTLLEEVKKLNYHLPKLKEIEKLYIDKITHHDDDENYGIKQEKILQQIEELNKVIENVPKIHRRNIFCYIFSISISVISVLCFPEDDGVMLFFTVGLLLCVVGLVYQLSQKDKNNQKVEEAIEKRNKLQTQINSLNEVHF